MRIRALKVGAHTYRVEQVETPELDDAGRWAEIDRRRYLLRLQSWERPPAALVESLIHELIHAWANDAAVGWDTDVEEQVATVLSPRITAFFADNPDAVRAMLEMLT